jgi:sulfate transport system permease protein
MAATLSLPLPAPAAARQRATAESAWVRWTLIAAAALFLGLFLVAPLVAVFTEALRKGVEVYFASLVEPDAWAAIKLTLLIAAIAVPANLVFGVAAAWAIAKFNFRGKNVLITLIDLPFAVSPGSSTCWYSARRAGWARGCKSTTSRSSLRFRVSCSRPSS